jgi:hypothetical protein
MKSPHVRDVRLSNSIGRLNQSTRRYFEPQQLLVRVSHRVVMRVAHIHLQLIVGRV